MAHFQHESHSANLNMSPVSGPVLSEDHVETTVNDSAGSNDDNREHVKDGRDQANMTAEDEREAEVVNSPLRSKHTESNSFFVSQEFETDKMEKERAA
ncbi:hypothetical protein AC579_2222 [Pseudocercospora musae]|uniref:Uncharacterized protein n=1 Tax=Pseudocercospora musae TaxID=113226 RepID=A0A139IKZ5_9PEZI|nr:hypothetical protein AC579_2222 [Pseudocercospora musae]